MKHCIARVATCVFATVLVGQLAVSLWFLSPGCTPEMGASDNFEETGRQERGRDPGKYQSEVTWDPEEGEYVWEYDLHYSDVILSPDGRRLLAMVPVPKADELF